MTTCSVHPERRRGARPALRAGPLRQPDDPLLAEFLPLYYSELPEGDVDDRKLDDIYAVAVAHLAARAACAAPGRDPRPR